MAKTICFHHDSLIDSETQKVVPTVPTGNDDILVCSFFKSCKRTYIITPGISYTNEGEHAGWSNCRHVHSSLHLFLFCGEENGWHAVRPHVVVKNLSDFPSPQIDHTVWFASQWEVHMKIVSGLCVPAAAVGFFAVPTLQADLCTSLSPHLHQKDRWWCRRTAAAGVYNSTAFFPAIILKVILKLWRSVKLLLSHSTGRMENLHDEVTTYHIHILQVPAPVNRKFKYSWLAGWHFYNLKWECMWGESDASQKHSGTLLSWFPEDSNRCTLIPQHFMY